MFVGNGTATEPRLPQDVNVNPAAPPVKDSLGRTVGNSPSQNAVMQADVDYLKSINATDIRVNQQQVDGAVCRVGICRLDVQATLPNGRRITIEYDTTSSTRAADHAARTLSNDPNAIVILRTVN